MRSVRLAVLCAVLVGVVITVIVGSGPVTVHTNLTAYGSGPPQFPATLIIGANSSSFPGWLLAVIIVVGLLVLGAIAVLIRRARA